MRLVFFGCTSFGLKALHEINGIDGVTIAGVITAKKKFKISYNPNSIVNFLHADFPTYCSSIGLACYELVESMNEAGLSAAIKSWRPDLVVVCGWYHKIPQSFLLLYPFIGLHASLLPKYRGGAPLVWAMINGEKETGITLFKFDKGIDTGDIIGQLATSIEKDDDIRTLYTKIEALGLQLLREKIPQFINGTVQFTPQLGPTEVMPQRSPEDGFIHWNRPAVDIVNFVRAQTRPYPGAFTFIDQKKIHVWKCCPTPGLTLVPGEILRTRETIFIGTQTDAIQVLDYGEDA